MFFSLYILNDLFIINLSKLTSYIMSYSKMEMFVVLKLLIYINCVGVSVRE